MTVDELKETFGFFDDWEDKYRFVIDLGKELPDMPDADKREENLVRGCQSQVWLTHNRDDSGRLLLRIDSDAFIVRGLISIVLAALNEKTPQEILDYDVEGLFDELELLQHLSATRGNGLRAMVARIQHLAESEVG